MSRKQVNVALPEDLARRVQEDIARHNVGQADYFARALEVFLSETIERRRARLSTVPPKRMGRKISAATTPTQAA